MISRRSFLKAAPLVFAPRIALGDPLGLSDPAFLSPQPVASGGGGGSSLVTSGLLLQLESSDFDGSTNGTAITAWNDLSGNGHNYSSAGASTAVQVDGTITANGHKTVKINPGGKYLSIAKFFTAGYSGLDVMCVYRTQNDPPGVGTSAGPAVMFTQQDATTPNHHPYLDSHFYDAFGTASRIDKGNPTTSSAGAFHILEFAVKSDGSLIDAWLGSENFYHATSGYSYAYVGSESTYTVGYGPNSGSNYWLDGNVAAVYVYDHYLSSGDRTQNRSYCTSKWGT